MAISLFKQTVFGKLIVEINADSHNELVSEWFAFYNHSATDGEFHIIEQGKSGYFYTNEQRLIKSFENRKILNILSERDKESSLNEPLPEWVEEAKAYARQAFSEISERQIIYS